VLQQERIQLRIVLMGLGRIHDDDIVRVGLTFIDMEITATDLVSH
jgi:hypothetical protein